MKKNPIQFQKGFSLTDFMKRYGSEIQCAEALFRLAGRPAFNALAAVVAVIA
ncbi:hypothetical protein MKLM6_1816 [Methylomonas koyamae]|nr:hypothetical protein MKLM6_1816 [Methylomonas koyamae]